MIETIVTRGRANTQKTKVRVFTFSNVVGRAFSVGHTSPRATRACRAASQTARGVARRSHF